MKEGTDTLWALFSGNTLIDQGTEINDGIISKKEVNEMAEKKGLALIHVKQTSKISKDQQRQLISVSDDWKDFFSI